MKQVFSLLALLTLIFSCVNNQTRDVKKYTIEQFFKNILTGGGYFSPNESKLLVTSNKTGIPNIFSISIENAQMTQLTKSTANAFWGLYYVPDGNGFLYFADKAGDENDHIYWVDEKGNTTDLTPFEGSKSNFHDWSKDEKSFFFISNKRDPKFFDLYELAVTDFKNPGVAKMIYKNETGMWLEEISPNKRYIVLNKAITTSDNDLYIFDLETKKMKHITKHTGATQYESEFFDNANENLFLTTNENSEFMYLAKYNIKSGKMEMVYQTNWDIWYAYNSYNEKYRVIGINEDAKTIIHLIDLKTKEKVKLPEIKGGSITSVNISKSEKLIRLIVSSSTSTNNLYVFNTETNKLTQLTNTLNPEIDQNDLVEAEVIRYKSYIG
jgi:Tol biopolymer transport system component